MNHPRIHVCLVSSQPLPNLLPLLDRTVRPQRVIFVVGDRMRERLEWLRSVLQGRGMRIDEWPIDDPWDFDHVQTRIMELLEREREALYGKEIALNATGGTKPMSIAAYDAFRAYDLPVFYVHPEKDRVVWFVPEGRAPHDLADRIRLEPFLASHGVEVRGEPRRNVPEPERLEVAAEIIAGIGRYRSAIGTLNWLAAGAERNLRSRNIPHHSRSLELEELIDLLERRRLLKRVGDRLVFPDEEARFFVNGGWLEYHVFDAVRRIRSEDPAIQDAAFGIGMVRRSRGKAVPNELDVAFLRNNRLHLIECKTRKFAHDDEDAPGSEALYKLETLTDLTGGLQARAMLISYRELRGTLRARAADLGVSICAGEDLQRLREHLLDFVR